MSLYGNYYDEMYPDMPYTYQDADIREAGGACPFQASGVVGGNEFYFRVRHGSASLEITNERFVYSKHTSVNTAEYGYLDGTCDMETFEKLFDLLIADFREVKVPTQDIEDGQYDFTDLSDVAVDYQSILVLTGKIADAGIEVSLNINGELATLETDNGYYRQLDVFTMEYDFLNGNCSDSGSLVKNPELLTRVFNALMADYID